MTPAAVGQQIRALEDHLGVVLFRRTSKGLELTPEGAAGLDALREGFLRFEESVDAMQAGQAADRDTIAAPREVYGAWLAPRLAPFQASTPGVQYILAPDDASDFTEANLDIAIRFIAGPGELEGVQLAPALKVLVAAPEARDAWIDWPEAGLPEEAKACIKASSAGQAMTSALAGMGRTVLPLALVESAIEDGSLLALDEPVESKRAYWLVAPLPQWRSKKVKALVSHLVS